MTKGFFDEEDFVTTSTDHLCFNCDLNKKCKHPKIQVTGNGQAKILIITDSPNKEEDSVGKLFCDNAGLWFRDQLKKRKYNLHDDFWITSATQCYSEEPTRGELTNCFPNILKIIREKKPKFVWLVGEYAIQSWFMSRFSDLSQERWRGLCIPDFERNVWVIPIYHPSFIIKDEKNTLKNSQYIRDLTYAIFCSETKKDLKDLHKPNIDNVIIMKDFDQVCDELENLIDNPPKYLAFDYETTGLKPYREGHKVASISYCHDFDKAYSFPYQYPHWTPLMQKQIKEKWIQVLLNNSLKEAHNAKFEDVWSKIIFKTTVKRWHWDSMIVAHIIDNRAKYTGLKFQSFLHWGIPNYSREIKPYLEAYDETGFNRVMKAPLNKLLLYGGIDSLLEYWLMITQKPLIDEHLEKGVDLFIEGTLALADVQIHGINVSAAYYKDTHADLNKQIKTLDSKLLLLPECIDFKNKFGHPPNLGSNQDLSTIFFDILKLKPPKEKSKAGNYPVDAEVVAKLDSELAKSITALNRLKKIDGTYISQFIREIDDDGRIHPMQDISNVRTYRGSNNRPNFQNIPVRNEEAKRYSRSGIMPSPGFKILDWDYGAIEVRMGACYTHDPALIAYILDPSTDMHRDTAADIFDIHKASLKFWKDKKTGNKLRFYAKNGFVFPEWYGSYYKNCASNIWRECSNILTEDGVTVFEHLQERKIIKNRAKALDDFTNHVKKVEDAYWKKLKVFKQWQDDMYRLYEKDGTVELLSGFRCKGYIGRNEIVNYRFQGSAFHCLLWSLSQINAEFKENKMDSKVVGQIHDCCLVDTHPDEEKEVKSISTEIATLRIREYFKWINVPLIIEWEETEIDKSWYSKKETRDND